MAKQFDLDKAYMECAFAMAKLSYAKRKKVGAIIVSAQNGIIAEGYNGTPSGFDNCCETEEFNALAPTIRTYKPRLVTKPEVLHAESNAITKIAKSTNSSLGSTLYCTCSPCFDCSKLIIQVGIKRVVYAEKYRISDGLDLLKKANIEICYLNNSQTI